MTVTKSKRSGQLGFIEDLIENLPIGMMILDKNGKIIRINKKQEETSRIKRELVIGKNYAEAFPKTLEQGLKKPYSSLLKRGTPFDVIIDNYFPQYYSERKTYHARGAPLSSGKYCVLLHELEEELYHEKRLVEKRTKELEESKKFLESLIDSSPNIIVSTDLKTRVIIFNKTAENTFGYSKEEVAGRKVDFLFSGAALNWDMKSLHSMEVLCVKKNHNSFPASLLTAQIKNTAGKVIGTLYLLNDLTERKEMEERLLLSEKLALYSELMGGIAHQLNNPLIGVVNFSEILVKKIANEDPRRELGETISKAGRECLKIVTSVLNSIKDPHLTFSKINLNNVLINSLHSLKEQLGEQLEKISIDTKTDLNLPPIIGDEIQLKQCLLNILNNAIQAMGKEGSLRVESEYHTAKKEVNLIISDNGPGIPREYLHKIFLPFFSLGKDNERHGLGLSFAYQIVKNHGGDITVKSEVGGGSTFIISLPTY
jgi:PAS domain S-box-containing protein